MPSFEFAISHLVTSVTAAPGTLASRRRKSAPCESGERRRAQGALASLAARYAPGTVAYLTHLFQLEAANAGIPMGSLNRAFAQTKGDCGF